MIKKYFRELIMLVMLVSWSVLFVDNWKLQNTIDNQSTQVASLASKLSARAATPDKVIISCANNQKDYLHLLKRMEDKYKMPKGLLKQVAYHESNFNPSALSHKGAVGIMQLVPKWHPDVNARDPYDAIPYAAKWLTELYNRFGDWELALAAWNWGPGNMAKYSFHEAPRETKNFVRKVINGTHIT
jgi:soluble lytic murein transglycosylase-like protein